ncbi:MAG: hypothetical protein ACRC0R_06455 [Cetobacterium sp.]
MGKVLSRHNILFPDQEYQEIKDYCKKIGISVSQFIREIAIEKVRKGEERNLLNFINSNCDFVTSEEEQEIDSFMKNYGELPPLIEEEVFSANFDKKRENLISLI